MQMQDANTAGVRRFTIEFDRHPAAANDRAVSSSSILHLAFEISH
jgi:hypothetical protein